jgi:organic radical activating enzyme
MKISQQPPKPFPIKKGLPCQLKWTHSTVYLTDGVSASCHRVSGDPLEYRSNGELNFHNLSAKLEARTKMLGGEWPGRGCEHCKHIEEAGGTSDRMIHLHLEGTTAPPELDKDLTAVDVTPRQLEVYWGNTCNLKCQYCAAHFSSTIDHEEKKFGIFQKDGVKIGSNFKLNPLISQHTEDLFRWFEGNIQDLHKLMILGGEPFLQKETFRMIEFLEQRTLPDLTLVFFSNLTVEHERFRTWMMRLQKLVDEKRLDKINVIGSLDCWGPQAEYIRNGLNLKLWEKNFEWMVYNTDFTNNVNSAFSLMSAQTMPELAERINHWSRTKPVYWSMMKCAQRDFGSSPYLYPGIFGDRVLDLGLRRAVEIFDPSASGYRDSVKALYKDYMNGICQEMATVQPNIARQKQYKIFLEEIDRRRGTDYKTLFPSIAQWLELI